jgi:DNA-binding MarR family transcriptional regulator
MASTPDHDRELTILERIELDPDATQATLASQLGVAVGTINWHLKRLVAKGYVKVRRVERRKLRYIITPEGVALRARLTLDYIQNSFKLYRLVRERVVTALQQVKQAGYHNVQLSGEGDVADICRLTCIEQNMPVVDDSNAPILQIQGLKVMIDWQNDSSRFAASCRFAAGREARMTETGLSDLHCLLAKSARMCDRWCWLPGQGSGRKAAQTWGDGYLCTCSGAV